MIEDMTDDQRARLDRVLDRQDIVHCPTRFSRGMDRFDRDLVLFSVSP
jgi:hypothetical protein